MSKILKVVKPGVLFGKDVDKVFEIAKKKKFAIPAVNVTSSSTVNSTLAAAAEAKSPIIVQVSHGGAAYFAGKEIDNSNHRASILGAVIMAKHVHVMAKEYGVLVILHTDHCSKENLPWLDGLIKEDQKHFKKFKRPLFSSHMIDLSKEDLRFNVKTSKKYLTKLSKIKCLLEIEIGVTGGEEDGVDNTSVSNSKLYTQPEDVEFAYSELMKVSSSFTIAATFGNVHGVYKPGNVKLRPEILKNCQSHVQKKFRTSKNPLNLVFHGTSGSNVKKVKESLNYGIVKVNIDTDMQWAYWDGVRLYEKKFHNYLQGQLGNPKGKDNPNKKFYDPRKWMSFGEDSMKKKLVKVYEILNCVNKN